MFFRVLCLSLSSAVSLLPGNNFVHVFGLVIVYSGSMEHLRGNPYLLAILCTVETLVSAISCGYMPQSPVPVWWIRSMVRTASARFLLKMVMSISITKSISV